MLEVELDIPLLFASKPYGEVVDEDVDRTVLVALVALGTNASNLSRVVVWLPFTIRGIITVIKLATRLVSGTRYRTVPLAGPRVLVYREFPWNNVLFILYVVL